VVPFIEVRLGPTVNRPIHLGVGLPSGTHDHILFCIDNCGFLTCGALSDERMDP
jgi:hypothetical protein